MTVSLETKRAEQPFQFMAASYLIRIGAQPVYTLGDFAKSLRTCPQASIFYHTFQSLEAHHYTSFSSDFAQWGDLLVVAEIYQRLAVLDSDDKLVGYIGADPDPESAPGWPTRPGWPNDLSEDGRAEIPLLPQHDRFNSPHSVAADADGNLYVSEWLLGGRYTKLTARR